MKFLNKKMLMALLMACVLIFSTLLTACGETDPVKYEQKLEKSSVETAAAIFAEAYDEYISAANKSKAESVNMAIDIDIAQSAIDLIESLVAASGVELDLSALSNISIDGEMYAEPNKLTTADLSVGLGDTELFGIDAIVNIETNEFLMGLPGILTKYMKIDMAAIESSMAVAGVAPAEAVDLSKLPDGKTVEALINKYAAIIIDGIKTVERTEGKAVANGVELDCDILTVTVTQEEVKEISKTLLTEARNDKELEAVVVALGEFADDDTLYPDMCTHIDEMLTELESYSTEGESPLVVSNYVYKNKIIGRAFTSDGEEQIAYIYAENKDGFGFELRVVGEQLIVGKGTDNKKFNGDFYIYADDNVELRISVKDLEFSLKNGGTVEGIIEIDLSALLETAGESLSFLGNSSVLRMEIAQKGRYDASVVYGLADTEGTYLVKLSAKTSKGSGEVLERPADENIIVIPVADMDEAGAQAFAMELVGCLDIESIKGILDKLPIPTEYASQIDQVLMLLEMLA